MRICKATSTDWCVFTYHNIEQCAYVDLYLQSIALYGIVRPCTTRTYTLLAA